MAEQNGDELSKIDTTMLQGAFAQLAAVVLTDVRACGKSAFCACKTMIVYAPLQRLASEPGPRCMGAIAPKEHLMQLRKCPPLLI